MFKYKLDNYFKDLSMVRRLIMLSLAHRDFMELVPYAYGNYLTFSVRTDRGEEVYPFLFTDKVQLLEEASYFLQQYNLNLEMCDEQQDTYTII